ncbi:MAG: alanine racemase [Anaerolineales bacterium]|nr:MAG: alanine racemase [Anaerolineales bacterium]
MDQDKRYATWVEIDLSAIESNVSYFCEMTAAKVMAVVKANAYGHGSYEVAQAALRGGASWLAVARADEVDLLRQAGVDAPILILGYTPPLRMVEMIQGEVALTVWSPEQVELLGEAAAACGLEARLHLKVDTGMSRLGVGPVEVLELVEQIERTPGVFLEGIFTHMARADEADSTTTELQLSRFQEVIEGLQTAGLRPPIVHFANSAATLKRAGTHMDLVRVGIAMYGLQPSPETPLPAVIRPSLTWKSVLAQVKTLPAGRGISYGHQYTTKREERIGTIPVGYADGLRRVEGNQVLVGSRVVPVVGRVTMDQIMVNLDSLPEAQAGDEVVILGSQVGVRIRAEDIASRWGTINYEVTSGIAARVPRLYLGRP